MESTDRLRNAGILLVLIVVIGVGGYTAIEGWAFHDALYMTIITLTTVGYREVHPLSTAGQYFTMFLLATGVGTVFYILIAAIEFMVEGQLKGILRRKRVARISSRMFDHYILCGYGRVGREVAGEFVRAGATLVIIEQDQADVDAASADGYLCILGDATRDEVLEEAGIRRAKGVICALSEDVKNVVVTLTARTLNPDAFIVARAEEAENHRKLKHAGADRTISPYSIGGRRMATMMLQPHVTDYLDLVTIGDRTPLRIEELVVTDETEMAGKTLKEIAIQERTGSTVVAIYRKTGRPEMNPTADTLVEEEDVLLVLGEKGQLDQLSATLSSERSTVRPGGAA